MRVPMMQIGIVRMRMHERYMAMRVGVRLGPVPQIVRMPMVLVMDMRMAVFLRCMSMQVFVAFREMQPDAHRHQNTGSDETPRHRLSRQQQRQRRSAEGSDRKVGGRPRGTKMPER